MSADNVFGVIYVCTYHVHTSHSIGSIFSLYNRFAVCIEPVPKLPLQLFGDKLRLTKVVIPGVITVAENYVTELYLEDDGRDQRCLIKTADKTE